jgi:trimethylamine--corrinoid protein Co-methyltransferase
MGNATVVMPAMIVATNEILAMLDHLLGPVSVDEDAFCLDVMEEVGPGGEFVTQPHTYERFRDVWYPELFFRGGAEAWERSEGERFEERVGAETRRLMEEHEPAPLPKEVAEAIRDVVIRAERRAVTERPAEKIERDREEPRR